MSPAIQPAVKTTPQLSALLLAPLRLQTATLCIYQQRGKPGEPHRPQRTGLGTAARTATGGQGCQKAQGCPPALDSLCEALAWFLAADHATELQSGKEAR